MTPDLAARVEEIRRRRIPGNQWAANPLTWPCEDVETLLAILAAQTTEIAQREAKGQALAWALTEACEAWEEDRVSHRDTVTGWREALAAWKP